MEEEDNFRKETTSYNFDEMSVEEIENLISEYKDSIIEFEKVLSAKKKKLNEAQTFFSSSK